MDSYIGPLYGEDWQEAQVNTQFQGLCSSHSLAAFLLTEAIQHTMYITKQTIFRIFLDDKFCFDISLFESLIREVYLSGTQDQEHLLI